jgi:tRNA uridine 5-carbamoylmethylation protein Kti12
MEAPKTLYIMRGVPGSGKSTLAKQLAEGDESKIFSTDDYWMKDGTYQFDPKMLGNAHEWNQVSCYLLLCSIE